MKNFSFLTAALALVLGLSQCAKPNLPTPNGIGVTQEVTLTTSFDDGSKVSGDYTTVTKELKLTWDGDETIEVTAGGTGTLQCTGVSGDGKTATFTGTVTHSAGDLTFSVNGKTSCDYMQQDGTMDWIMSNIVLQCTCQFNEEAEYGGLMELPFAVAKLDLSAFGTAAGSDVTVSVDNAVIATVKGVKNTKGSKFVALPVAGSKKDYKFQGTGDNSYKNLYKTWTLEKNKYYTKADAAGQPTGNDIVIPTYSVAADRTVTFAPGNLYSNGSDTYFFETNQWDYANTMVNYTDDGYLFYDYDETNDYYYYEWNPNHVGHFYFEKFDYKSYAYKKYPSYYPNVQNYYTPQINDFLFTNASATTPHPSFTANGQTGVWRTLSEVEWSYIVAYRANASNLRSYKQIEISGTENFVVGLILLPDNGGNSDLGNIKTTDDLITYDAIFLPAAGYRLVKYGETRVCDDYYFGPGYGCPCGSYHCSETFSSDKFSSVLFGFDSRIYTDYSYKRFGNTIRCVR